MNRTCIVSLPSLFVAWATKDFDVATSVIAKTPLPTLMYHVSFSTIRTFMIHEYIDQPSLPFYQISIVIPRKL